MELFGQFKRVTRIIDIRKQYKLIIPYGISEVFLTSAPPSETPPQRAVFTSNPMRSLDWLLDVWEVFIRAYCPEAELHIFSGPSTYREAGAAKAEKMTPVLERAKSMFMRLFSIRL